MDNAIIGPMTVNEVTHKTELDIEKLEPDVRERLKELEAELYGQVEAVSKSALGIGKTLTEIHNLLEPLHLFTFYLNRLVWLPASSAYRYMATYKRLGDKLPEVVVEKAIASGMPLFSYSDARPYGRYTKALEMMPEAPEDEQGAEQWLYTLRLKVKELGQRPVRDAQERVAEFLAREYLKDPKVSVREWMRSLEPLVAALVKKRA
jgi:hypothetical protein